MNESRNHDKFYTISKKTFSYQNEVRVFTMAVFSTRRKICCCSTTNKIVYMDNNSLSINAFALNYEINLEKMKHRKYFYFVYEFRNAL